jgi:hypothetical protein
MVTLSIAWDLTYLLDICLFFIFFGLYLLRFLSDRLFVGDQFIYRGFILMLFFFATKLVVC